MSKHARLSAFLLTVSKTPAASPVLVVLGWGTSRLLPTFVTVLFIRTPTLPVSHGKILIFFPPPKHQLNIK